MGFILKVVLICVALGGLGLGNLGFRAPESIATGVLGVIASLIALTFLLKFLWRFLGCLTTILIALVLIVILLILTGTFDTVAGKVKGFFSETSAATNVQVEGSPSSSASSAQVASAPANYLPVVNSDGTTSFVPVKSPAATASQQARNSDTFTGSISAIRTGSRFVVGDLEISLYGVDAPDAEQVCSDKRGRPYNCGQEAIRQLRRFTGATPLDCKIKARGQQGANLAYAVCNIDNNDIGVAMVSSGWAVSLPEVTSVYVPYEEVAKSSHSGMWGGQFYRPAEWRMREAAENRASSGSGSFFSGLF